MLLGGYLPNDSEEINSIWNADNVRSSGVCAREDLMQFFMYFTKIRPILTFQVMKSSRMTVMKLFFRLNCTLSVATEPILSTALQDRDRSHCLAIVYQPNLEVWQDSKFFYTNSALAYSNSQSMSVTGVIYWLICKLLCYACLTGHCWSSVFRYCKREDRNIHPE